MADGLDSLARMFADLDPDIPILLLGPPGIGKSACAVLVAQYVEKKFPMDENGFPTVPCPAKVIDLACRLPEDILGLPFREKNITFYAPPLDIAEGSKDIWGDGQFVYVFDDLPTAQMSVQTATYRLFAERRTGSVELSPNARLIATGNRREDQSGAIVLPAALRNRMLIFEIEPDLMQWTLWYMNQGYSFDIPAFLRWKPEHFSKLPKSADEKGAYATPRSWVKVAKSLETAKRYDRVLQIASAAVGEGIAVEFKAFIDVQKDLPDPDAILDNPRSAVPSLPTKVDVLIAMMSMIANRAAKARGKRSENIQEKFISALAYLTQQNREYAGVAIDAYFAGGGNVPKIALCVKAMMQKDSNIKSLMSHIQCAIQI